ncbi:hypothetical protein CDD82_3382 [Ophiocordyceps australis]|uniref:Uncharacterized protein n=1 Tax=Ophiocordyceps australis TaxID=1399860 RepID=A0A2C5ZDA1_9HYPO|nr:hypothetical protein CDD82_3382 [Ophiocordyceps australis]
MAQYSHVDQINQQCIKVQDSLIIFRNTGPSHLDSMEKLAIDSAMGACNMLSLVPKDEWAVVREAERREIVLNMRVFDNYLGQITRLAKQGYETSDYWYDSMWFFAMAASACVLYIKIHDCCNKGAVEHGTPLPFSTDMELVMACALRMVHDLLYTMKEYCRLLRHGEPGQDFSAPIIYETSSWLLQTEDFIRDIRRHYRIRHLGLDETRGRTPARTPRTGIFSRFSSLHRFALYHPDGSKACKDMAKWIESRIEHPAMSRYNLALDDI